MKRLLIYGHYCDVCVEWAKDALSKIGITVSPAHVRPDELEQGEVCWRCGRVLPD